MTTFEEYLNKLNNYLKMIDKLEKGIDKNDDLSNDDCCDFCHQLCKKNCNNIVNTICEKHWLECCSICINNPHILWRNEGIKKINDRIEKIEKIRKEIKENWKKS